MTRDFLNWVSTQPCTVCGGGTYHEDRGAWLADPAHIRTRGSTGGTVHLNNVIPLCRQHHSHC